MHPLEIPDSSEPRAGGNVLFRQGAMGKLTDIVNKGVRLIVTGTAPGILKVLRAHGVQPPLVAFAPSIDDAVRAAVRSRAPGA